MKWTILRLKMNPTKKHNVLLMQAILLLDFACLLKRVSLPKWLPHTPLQRNCNTSMLPLALPPTKYPQTLQTYFSSRLSWSSPTRLLRTCSLQCSPYTVPAISSSNLKMGIWSNLMTLNMKIWWLLTILKVGLHLINTTLRIVHYEILPLLLDINDLPQSP